MRPTSADCRDSAIDVSACTDVRRPDRVDQWGKLSSWLLSLLVSLAAFIWSGHAEASRQDPGVPPHGVSTPDRDLLDSAIRDRVLQQARLAVEGEAGADGTGGDVFGWSVAVSGDTALVGAKNDGIGNNGGQGSAYVFIRSGGNWVMQAKLVADDGQPLAEFGGSLALSGDTALIGARNSGVGSNTGQGLAYVFVRIGDVWHQQAKLVADDGNRMDRFGHAVALDGDTAIVAAPYHDLGTSIDRGAAYVFIRTGNEWHQRAKLVGSDGEPADEFGWAVSLVGDTALVSAPSHDVGANDGQGAAYVFVAEQSNWIEQTKLLANDGVAASRFGVALDLSGDSALIGAYTNNSGTTNNRGTAYVFARQGSSWVQQQRLDADDGAAFDFFGSAVALSGNTAVVGAHSADIGASLNQGATYIFSRSGTTWALQSKLVATNGVQSDSFGHAVDIAGETAFVGAIYADIEGRANLGATLVFQRGASMWPQKATLSAGRGLQSEGLGVSVALSGETAVVGAFRDDPFFTVPEGSAYVFTRSGSTWTMQAGLIPMPSAGRAESFGASVAIHGDTAVVGAPQDSVGGSNERGSTFVFRRTESTWRQEAQLIAADGAVGDFFGASVAISGDTIIVGAFGDDVRGNVRQGSAYVFVRSGTTWSLQQKLIASDEGFGHEFGMSVGMTSDFILVGAPGSNVVAGQQGAAYIFERTAGTWTQRARLAPEAPTLSERFGLAVALGGDTALIGGNNNAAHVFVRTGVEWTVQARITPEDATAWHFGHSVAIDRNNIVVGASLSTPNTEVGQGAAYAYSRQGTTWTKTARLTADDGDRQDSFGFAVALSGSTALVGASLADGSIPFGNPHQGAAYVYTAVGIQDSTTTIATISPSPSLVGDAVSVNVIVTGNDTRPADGMVTIIASTGESCADMTSLPVGGSGALFACPLSFATVGPRTLIATYGESETHADSMSSDHPHRVMATLSLSPAALPNGAVGTPYRQSVTASGAGSQEPYRYSVSDGALPAGLSIDPATGVIDGTPSTAAVNTFTITAADASSIALGGPFTGARTYTVQIARGEQAPLVARASPPHLDFNGSSVLGTSGGSGSGPVSFNIATGATHCVLATANLTAAGADAGAGSCVIEATKAADANYNAAVASTVVTVGAGTDLETSKTDRSSIALPGSFVEYEILAANAGPYGVVGARIRDPVPAELENAFWTCTPLQAADCPELSGTGDIDQTVDLPVNGVLRYVMSAEVSATPGTSIANTVTISVPPGIAETQPDDNAATDTNLVVPDGVFVNGFEVETPTVSVPVPLR